MRLTLDLAAAALQAASWMFPSTGTPTLEPEPEPELRDTILQPSTRAYLSSLRERWGVPGVAISVVVGPKYDGGDWRSEHVLLGEADVHGSPITSDSMFGIASNSKLFAALAMGMVIDNGTKVPHTGEKLDWRTKVVDVLPDWKVPDEYATRHITIRDLLTMHSGLPSHDLSHRLDVSVQDTVHNMRSLPMSAEIREVYQSNNLHYIMIDSIVAATTGVPFVDYVKEHILDPVGLKDTMYNHTAAAETGRRTHTFAHVGVNKTECALRSHFGNDLFLHKSCRGSIHSYGWWTPTDGIAEAGCGGLVSSIQDVVLPPSLISACAESYTIESNEHAPHCSQTTYGYGQVSSTFRGEQVVYHTGGFPGQTTYIGRIPERDIGIAILTNTYFSGRNVFTIGSYRILEDLLNVTDPYDYEAWRFELIFPKVNSTRLRPAHPAPAPEGVDVEGTYVHPGYGKMELRRFDSDAHTPIGEAITAELKLRTIDTTTTPTFIANFSRTFVSHFAFTHFSGSIYNATSFQYYEDVLTGEPINDFSDLGTAVFTEGGFGLWDLNQADPKFHRPLSEDKVQENADIWFERR